MDTLLMPSVRVSVRKISFQLQLPNLRSADYFALGAERGIYLMPYLEENFDHIGKLIKTPFPRAVWIESP
jgi:hypothetical protein